MKKLLKILGIILATFVVIIILLYTFNYGYILRGLQVIYLQGHTTAYIDDYTEFDNRVIEAGDTHIPWPQHKEYNTMEITPVLREINDELETVAFLIIKNDSIWYENYVEGYDRDSKTNSFSMAKSITTALLGKAIEDGYIKSLDQPVTDFFPDFSSPFNSPLTVGDLASMSSGLNWDENYYNPFSKTARVYFDKNIREVVLDLEVISEPGREFEYLSGNTLLLGLVIETATGKKLSNYTSESFWKPLGMRSDALWQLDSEESGLEKAYCCIASNARDFAKFGLMFKNKGAYNGEQILNASFVEKAIQPRFEDSPQYGYGLWLSNYLGKDIFYMRGVLGQYVIVIPEDDLIIVRLGHKLMKRVEDEQHSPDFFIYVKEVYNTLENAL